jgi:APA family basic amino acid/polyamine antiporter
MSDSVSLARVDSSIDVIDDTLISDASATTTTTTTAASLSLSESAPLAGPRLKRTLSTLDLTAIGIGGIIGAGIFVLSGQAAARYAGPAVVVSFAISGVGCLLCGLSYSELASMFPVSGSAYAYTTAALGGVSGWLIGWDLTLEYAVGAATVAVGWSGYFCSAVRDMGGVCPKVMSSAPIGRDPITNIWHLTGSLFNAPAFTIVIALTAVAIRGARESATITNALVVLKLAVLVLFLFSSIPFVKKENWSPFFIPSTDTDRYGFRGIITGSSVVFFAFIGFDAISTASGEAKNPQRSVPIATLASLVVCTVLYIAVAFALTGLVSYTQLDVADPIAVAVDAAGTGLVWVRPIIKFGAVAGLTSVILVLLNGQARIAYSMSSDGLLPAALSYIHPTYRTPSNALLTAGMSAAVLAAFVPVDALGEMVSIGTLAAFAFVCIGVIVLRRTKPNMLRPFKTPYSPYVPALGAIMCIIQMIALPPETWLRLILWMVLGGVVYHTYSRHHMKPVAQRIERLLNCGDGGGGGEIGGEDADVSPITPIETPVAAIPTTTPILNTSVNAGKDDNAHW